MKNNIQGWETAPVPAYPTYHKTLSGAYVAVHSPTEALRITTGKVDASIIKCHPLNVAGMENAKPCTRAEFFEAYIKTINTIYNTIFKL